MLRGDERAVADRREQIDGKGKGAWWRRVVGFTLLLLGPTALAEVAARRSLDALYPFIRGYPQAADTKSLMLARDGCPDVLSLGTSQSDHTINRHYLRGRTIDGTLGPVFDFAIAGERGVNMYAIWRHVDAGGCVPRVVFVEAGPPVFNRESGGEVHDAPFLDLRTMLAIPRGYFVERGYSLADVVELATFDRLFIKRRSEHITKAVLARVRENGAAPAKKQPRARKGGRITGLPNDSLDGGAYPAERRKRLRMYSRGQFPYVFSDVEAEGVERLVEEATAAGSRVILHSPPTSPIYQEIVEDAGADAPWCAWYRKMRAREGVEWFSEFSGAGYERAQFHDFIHVNRNGARQYVDRIVAAVNDRQFPPDPYCEGR